MDRLQTKGEKDHKHERSRECQMMRLIMSGLQSETQRNSREGRNFKNKKRRGTQKKQLPAEMRESRSERTQMHEGI